MSCDFVPAAHAAACDQKCAMAPTKSEIRGGRDECHRHDKPEGDGENQPRASPEKNAVPVTKSACRPSRVSTGFTDIAPYGGVRQDGSTESPSAEVGGEEVRTQHERGDNDELLRARGNKQWSMGIQARPRKSEGATCSECLDLYPTESSVAEVRFMTSRSRAGICVASLLATHRRARWPTPPDTSLERRCSWALAARAIVWQGRC